MWGISDSRPRAARLFVTASVLMTLAACASHRPAPPPPAASVAPSGERDATGAYRFNMTQNGRRMSADEFDAWMKARGIRVATGEPAKPGHVTAQARSRSSAKPAVAVAGKPVAAKPAASKPSGSSKARVAAAPKAAAQPKAVPVAQAKPKAKPGSKSVAKPAAKAVSLQQPAPAARQASSEG
ncbi:MAG TPA: hypothetical protein VD865_10610 [Stenotrophomonas sp.]|nr:hypothetical protein [Stenotrophomonas sp.]